MAINTYSTLQTAVANWLDRNDLTDRIPEFISLAEATFNRTLRLRAMETTVSDTTPSGSKEDALPFKRASFEFTRIRFSFFISFLISLKKSDKLIVEVSSLA